MHIHYLSEQNSILNHFLAELRCIETQKDAMRFRKNMERIGEIMAYEVSKTLAFKNALVQTPLGTKETMMIKDEVVLCSILRAGLALHTGFMNFFDAAENGFVSAARTHGVEEILVEYEAVPNFSNKQLLLLDPMLATGHSMVAVFDQLMKKEQPKEIHLCVVIAAPEGIEYLKKHLPNGIHLWVASLDDQLNANKYIVPGIGDAGDLAYGEKL